MGIDSLCFLFHLGAWMIKKWNEIVFSLNKEEPSSSTSEEVVSSSGSEEFVSSSSSEGEVEPPCGQVFDTSLTTVLGANQDIPDLYYAESVSMVVITVGSVGNLQYNNLGPAGLPLTMDVEIGGEVVAQIQPGGDYNGRPFAFTYGGNTYCGNFIEGTVSF